MNIDLVMRKATMLLDRGDSRKCEEYLRERLREAESNTEPYAVGTFLCALGELMHAQERYAESEEHLRRFLGMSFHDDVLADETRRAAQLLSTMPRRAD
jgi:hypothetical protein